MPKTRTEDFWVEIQRITFKGRLLNTKIRRTQEEKPQSYASYESC
jgi:hypothetical protein